VLNLLHPDANIDTYGYCYCDHDTAAYSVTKGYCAAKASADSRATLKNCSG